MIIQVKIILGYVLIMTVIGFWSMYIDKRKARKHEWRVSEKTLFMIAILGGSIGSNLGMFLCRHKTKHWYFVIGMPGISILQIAAAAYVYIKWL